VGRDLKRARREWLHTNGAGAYASSTVAGMHTRRYHGLLVAALDPPRRRHVFLSHVDVTVTPARDVGHAGGHPQTPGHAPQSRGAPSSRPQSRPKWELGKHQFPGVDPETTPFHLERFDQDPLPRWTYRVAGGELTITLGLVRGENAVVLRYAFQGIPRAGGHPQTPEPLMLALRPLLAARDFHQLLREHGGMIQRVELRASEMRVQPRKDLPRLCFRYEGTFVGGPDWWRRFEYLAELDRGLDFEEDLWTPGIFEVPIEPGVPRYLVAAVDKLPDGEPADLLEAARAAIVAEDPGPRASPLVRRLSLAAESFRADLARHPAVIAGYPWFGTWGRDALVALPGLYLVPGRIDGALRVLREILGAMEGGVLPNRVPEPVAAPGRDGGRQVPERHAADATLWLFEAARHVADTLGDHHPFVTDELLLALRDAFEAALGGTRDDVRVTAEGLFAAGKPAAPGDAPNPSGDALTWMDARVNGKAVTPRAGCPIELTALWARGCDTLARLAHAAGDLPLQQRAEAERARARAAFHARFWCAETGYPYDVVSESPDGDGAFRDASVRPNAVLALSIDPDCFTPEQADAVLTRARRDLVTPAGLRSLARGQPGYVGRYVGGVSSRDAACHQGTAWPWLLGAYVRAALRQGANRAELRALVDSAARNELALGQVPEVADGDPPHAPAGAVAQAWSVAELLRALVWDLEESG
jgi:glycogen debranching enzyme